MKKLILSALAVAALGFTSNAQEKNAGKWTIDASHSSINFTIKHLVISDAEGRFKKFDGTLEATKEDFDGSKVSFTTDVNSVNTDNDDRDKHLKSPDFFDAAKFPEIKFESKTFKKVADKTFKVTGDLTMHGVTKSVTLDAKFNGNATDPYKNYKAGFKITGKVTRKEFNLAPTTPAAVLGEDVEIVGNIELNKSK